MIVKSRQCWGPGQLGAVVPWKRNYHLGPSLWWSCLGFWSSLLFVDWLMLEVTVICFRGCQRKTVTLWGTACLRWPANQEPPKRATEVSSTLIFSTGCVKTQLRSERSGARRILRKSELIIHMISCIYLYKGDQVKSRLHRTGIWSSAAWPAPVLSPSNILLPLSPCSLSFPRGGILRAFGKFYFILLRF